MPENSATEAQLRKRTKALRNVRMLFRESIADPLQAAILKRSPLATAQMVWSIPMETAAAGFTIEMMQDKKGWHVTLTRDVDADTALQAAGDAHSLIKALFQLVDATEGQIETLEAECRHALNQMELAAIAA